MIMDLIRSANDIRLVFVICVYLGKINEIDIESRRNTTPVVLTPRISETVALSRPCAADNFSSYTSTAAGHFFARTSSFETAWRADSERLTAEGNLRLFPKS